MAGPFTLCLVSLYHWCSMWQQGGRLDPIYCLATATCIPQTIRPSTAPALRDIQRMLHRVGSSSALVHARRGVSVF